MRFFPSLVTDGVNVHVAWYDSRLDTPAGGVIDDLDVFYNRSANAGASFTLGSPTGPSTPTR